MKIPITMLVVVAFFALVCLEIKTSKKYPSQSHSVTVLSQDTTSYLKYVGTESGTVVKVGELLLVSSNVTNVMASFVEVSATNVNGRVFSRPAWPSPLNALLKVGDHVSVIVVMQNNVYVRFATKN